MTAVTIPATVRLDAALDRVLRMHLTEAPMSDVMEAIDALGRECVAQGMVDDLLDGRDVLARMGAGSSVLGRVGEWIDAVIG